MQYQQAIGNDDHRKRFILFVEDNRGVSEIVKTIVSLATAYITLHVSDSAEALRALEQKKPDLLLLDYHLPTMSGVQLYDIVHVQDTYMNIPAIIISADTSPEVSYEVKRRQLMLISKPFRVVEFVSALDIYLT